MTRGPVVLTEGATAALRAAAAEASPREMVGLLAGSDSFTVQRFVPVAGADCAEDRFSMPGPAFAAAEAAIRARGERWLGFVHSHPRGSPLLSAADRQALWRDCLQLVVAPGQHGAMQIGAYWLTKDRIEALPVVHAGAASR